MRHAQIPPHPIPSTHRPRPDATISTDLHRWSPLASLVLVALFLAALQVTTAADPPAPTSAAPPGPGRPSVATQVRTAGLSGFDVSVPRLVRSATRPDAELLGGVSARDQGAKKHPRNNLLLLAGALLIALGALFNRERRRHRPFLRRSGFDGT